MTYYEHYLTVKGNSSFFLKENCYHLYRQELWLVLVGTLTRIRLMIFTNFIGLPYLAVYLPNLSYR